MAPKIAIWVAACAAVVLLAGCSKSESSPTTTPTPAPAPTPTPTPATATFTVTFGENPVPFRSSGCSGSTPQGWYTTARIQETAGVAFTPASLTQKLDGSPASALAESFGSRFGQCSGAAFTPGQVAANGSACATVGICTTGSFGTYQFEISGTDANSRQVTFSSPVLQLGAR